MFSVIAATHVAISQHHDADDVAEETADDQYGNVVVVDRANEQSVVVGTKRGIVEPRRCRVGAVVQREVGEEQQHIVPLDTCHGILAVVEYKAPDWNKSTSLWVSWISSTSASVWDYQIEL